MVTTPHGGLHRRSRATTSTPGLITDRPLIDLAITERQRSAVKGTAMHIVNRLSRRHTIRLLGGGSVAALVGMTSRDRRLATAQAPTPTPAYAAGITAEILGRIEPPAAPGYTLQLVRITFAPGAEVAAHRHSGGTVTTQLSGSHAFTVLDGQARLIRMGSATPVAGADAGEPMAVGQEYTLAPGDVIVFDESVVHTAHNPNTEPAVLMEAELRATDRPLTEFEPEMATPVA
jgi:quercetin dioxygenase-like cupin family protein